MARTTTITLTLLLSIFLASGCELGGDRSWNDDYPYNPANPSKTDSAYLLMDAGDHSPGFFQDFQCRFDSAVTSSSWSGMAADLDKAYGVYLTKGPAPTETVAIDDTWTEVATFMDIARSSASIMDGIPGGEASVVAMLEEGADKVLRSDVPAVEAWNSTESTSITIPVTGSLVAEAAELVLIEAGHAVVEEWVDSEEWVDGYWEETPGYYEEYWVPGHYEMMWEDGYCYDEYLGSDCGSYWVDGGCYDVYVDDGYWAEYCSWYDDWGNCVEWTSEYVDTGYYDTYCDGGYWAEECVDVYDTYCEDGGYVDVWVDGYYEYGAWIPGETYWVEGYWLDTSHYELVLLVDIEHAVLQNGATIVLALGPAGPCASALADALAVADDASLATGTMALEDALDTCLAF